MDECSDTRIHGRLGWKARPLAREDLDSNFVSMGDEEAEEAAMVTVRVELRVSAAAAAAVEREPQLQSWVKPARKLECNCKSLSSRGFRVCLYPRQRVSGGIGGAGDGRSWL